MHSLESTAALCFLDFHENLISPIVVATRINSLSSQDNSNQENDVLKKWATWGVVIGTAIWTTFFFGFLVVNALFPSSIPDSWFLDMVKGNPAGTIGIAIGAISSFSVVVVLDIFSRDPISFKFFSFEFKGASGPVILWVVCFLAFVAGTNFLWESSRSVADNQQYQPDQFPPDAPN